MTYRLTACPVAGCPHAHGVIHEARTARSASDSERESRGAADSAERRVGRSSGAQSSKPVGVLPTSESRKALSTTG